MLSEKEIHKYIRDVRQKKNRQLRNDSMKKLTEQFMPYIIKTVNKMAPGNFEEMKQVAIEGLYHAVENFKLSSGNKFFTYAYTCIYGYVGWALREKRLIRIPNTEVDKLKMMGGNTFHDAVNPYSLDTVFNPGAEKEVSALDFIASDRDDIRKFEGVDEIEREASICAQKKAVAFLENNIFSKDERDARPGAPEHYHDGEMFCHMYGILGRLKLSAKDISKMYNIDERVVTSRCNSIFKRLQKAIKKSDISLEDLRVDTSWLLEKNGPMIESEDGIGPLFLQAGYEDILTKPDKDLFASTELPVYTGPIVSVN